MRLHLIASAIFISVLLAPSMAFCGEPARALTIRLQRPDHQLELVLNLFKNERAPHPAAALASWRRATHDQITISKPAQAVIALFNPEMVRELRSLDGAEFAAWFSDTEQAHWYALLPADEGLVAALGTAMALTDGAVEPPLGEATVDRLGGPGSPVLGRIGTGVALSATRDDLVQALDHLRDGHSPHDPALESGWALQLLPELLVDGSDLSQRRLVAAARGLGCREWDATAALAGESLELTVTGQFDQDLESTATLEPEWLDYVPADRSAVALSVAFDTKFDGVRPWFELVDRIEKADPALAQSAPVRSRLNLISVAAGASLDSTVWPFTRGVTAWAQLDAKGRPIAAAVILHATDATSAKRIVAKALRPLSRTVERMTGRAIDWATNGPSVVIGWGEGAREVSLDAVANPAHSAGTTLRACWPRSGVRPQRAGGLWLGRLLPSSPPPVSSALAAAPPVVWWGATDGKTTHDRVRWGELHSMVHRVLAELPLDGPPRD